VSAAASSEGPDPGLFARGIRLVVSYVRIHPKPFAISVAGSTLFAGGSIAVTAALGRVTDEVLRPAFSTGVSTGAIWPARRRSSGSR
jgi:hypothetical protein